MIRLLFSFRFIISILIAGIICGIGLLIADRYIFPNYTQYNEAVTTPDVTQMHIEKAEQVLSDMGLRYEIIDRRSNSAYPVNYILDQNPAAGQLVKPNRKIYLKVNVENRPEVSVPNVINLSLRNARIQLQNYGLKTGTISYRSSPFKNTVLEQSIEAGNTTEKGSSINLIISDGLGVRMIPIPDILGKDINEAQRLIISSGFRVGTYRYIAVSNVPVNTVISFEPSDKKELLEGSEIDLIIAEEVGFQEYDEKFSINDSTRFKEGF